MPIPTEITCLIEQLNCELNRVERDVAIGIDLAIDRLNLYPCNTVLTQVLGFLYETLSFLEISKRQTQATVENLSIHAGSTDFITHELMQDLEIEIDGIIEAGIAIARLQKILEN